MPTSNNMNDLAGNILIATTALKDTYFEDAHLFITEHNDNGAAGFVFNKLFKRKLNELEEFSSVAAIDIYEGGPMDNEHLYFLHKNVSPGGEHIKDGIYFGGNIHRAASLLSQGKLSLDEIKIFIGYCGWNKGELEAEIAEGSWMVSHSPANIFIH